METTQDAVNAVRSVMFDVAVWQDRIAARSGTQLGPTTVQHEGGEAHGGADGGEPGAARFR